MKSVNHIAVFGLCLLMALTSGAEADITIAEQGKSTFTIVIPEKAPESIKSAAEELRRDIALSTNAKLRIKEDNEKVAGPIISLGATAQAKAAGIILQSVGDEGFRIQTKDNNLFIIGPDTADGEYTKNGGTSAGTANGVYTFLEDYLDVRWLMPEDIGRDVPQKSTFEIPEINRTETPEFIYRDLSYVQRSPSVEQWKERQKLGYSFRFNVGHNWYPTVPASLYKTHPEWFAMINGKRVDPVPLGNRYKLETTNPELVEYYAQKAVEAFKADPHLNTFSLSPNDSRGWSESPESKALYDPAPPGSDFPSITPLILKWYRDVSDAVAKKYPQGKLTGYIYTDFSRPPLQGSMELPKNFIPMITGQGFGYRFFRPEVRELEKSLIEAWSKVAPPTWFYYGLPIWLRTSTGMLTTAAPDNLNYMFSLLRDNHIKGAEIYGNFSWSQAAMGNYIEAKMLWNPSLDAHDLQREWLTRAYGAEAGAAMGELYNMMDNGAFAEYFRQDPSPHYNVREKMFKDYFGPNYPEIEKYFLRARSKDMTELQKKRLQLIENNLIVLQWRLRNAGYLREDFKSPLHYTNEEVAKILLARKPKSQTEDFPDLTTRPQKDPVKNVQIGQLPVAQKTKEIPNADRVLLYPMQDMTIHLKAANVQAGSSIPIYVISRNKETDESLYGYQEQRGVLYDDEDISFEARANTLYYFKAEPHGVIGGTVTWDMFVPDATPAKVSFQDDTLYLDGPPASLYVHAPLNMETQKVATGVSLLSKAASAVLQRRYPDAKPILNLDKEWQFTTDPKKTGLQQQFNIAKFDDASWKTVDATDYWQNQGASGYHGTAWYRKTFIMPPLDVDDPLGVGKRQLLLYFGAVDGDAVVYVNGEKIGEHLPSKLGEGWDQPFVLDATAAMTPDENTIAVQVTKDKYKSGMYKGVSLMIAEQASE